MGSECQIRSTGGRREAAKLTSRNRFRHYDFGTFANVNSRETRKGER
jgi:hypothetical protein